MTARTVDKPDILPIIEQYVVLRKTGKNYTGLCPFHSEKTPSFTVDTNRQRFKCFGCGESGDVLDFVQKIHGADFKSSLSILGIENGREYRPDPVEIRKKELERAFRLWEREYFNEVAAEYRLIGKALDALDPEDAAELLKRRTVLEYHLDILSGSDEGKVELYRAVRP